MTRAELLLKCVMSPTEPIVSFVDNYIKLMADYDINTFRMLLEMKGITKRSDLNNFLETFKTKIPTNNANSTSTLTQNVSTSSLTNNIIMNDNEPHESESRLKQFDRLQDLLRKKL